MDFKRIGGGMHKWNPEARYSVHDARGIVADFAGKSRKLAKEKAFALGNGYWVKDNINTYFYYQVTHGRIRRVRVGSRGHVRTKMPEA